MDTKNEVVIGFACAGEIDGLTVDAPEPPGMWVQCFVEGGACIPDESGFYFFDVASSSEGEVFIRRDGPLASGTPLSGSIFPDGFESNDDISVWHAQVP